jgi:hypothetical protein
VKVRDVGRLRRAFRVGVAAATCAIVATAVHGCLIVEPPGELPRVPERRPIIVKGSLVPTNGNVLGTFPDKFIVPVELSDPTATFQWSAFVNFNPLTGDGLVLVEESIFEPQNYDGRYRVLEVPIPPPLDLDRCHVVEIVVALRLLASTFEVPKAAHTPQEPGGDSAIWFYSPTGDLRGCPVLDAGPDAALVDAADAEGGPQ